MLVDKLYIRPKNQSDKGRVNYDYCHLPDGETCSLRERGECLQVQVLGRCVYGQSSSNVSPVTQRAKAYRQWRDEALGREVELPLVSPSLRRIEEIGQYVWLPFSHVTLCLTVPFVEHYKFFRNTGIEFLLKSDFTPSTIVTLVQFEARTEIGREIIPAYQKESVPTLLHQVKMLYPDLYQAAANLAPEIEEMTPTAEAFRGCKVAIARCPRGEYTFTSGSGEFLRTHSAKWDGKVVQVIVPQSTVHTILPFSKHNGAEEVTMEFAPYPEFRVEPDEEDLERLYEAGAFVGLEPFAR